MVRKLLYLICLVVVLTVLSANSNAAMHVWTGEGLDGMWNNANNWDQGTVPDHLSGDVGIADQTYGSLVTIPTGYAADCTFGNDYGTIFGPENGMDLDIYGSLTYKWYMAAVASSEAAPTVISMYNGSSIYGAEGIAVGDTWWYSGGPYVSLNMYGDASADINWLWIGGHLNMYGGTIDVSGGVAMSGNIADALIRMNIYGGKMILPDAFTDTVNNWISRGILTASGHVPGTDGYDIIIDTTTMPGRTIVTATPEPVTMTLLCLGGLALIRRKRS
jgi:hypothetical protein